MGKDRVQGKHEEATGEPETIEIPNPVEDLLAEADISKFDAALHVGVSYSRFCGIASGAAILLPAALVQMAEKVRGPGAGRQLQGDWSKFRASLSAEVHARLEKRYFPAGRHFGMQD